MIFGPRNQDWDSHHITYRKITAAWCCWNDVTKENWERKISNRNQMAVSLGEEL